MEVAEMLRTQKVKYDYEKESFPWLETVPNAYCPSCKQPAIASRSYTPDFFLNNGVVVEAKGRFTPKDRKIALAMKAKMGDAYKMVFQFDNRLSRKSKTRYSQWCSKHGIDFAIRQIPPEWAKELHGDSAKDSDGRH
jgi:hypothetical protein